MALKNYSAPKEKLCQGLIISSKTTLDFPMIIPSFQQPWIHKNPKEEDDLLMIDDIPRILYMDLPLDDLPSHNELFDIFSFEGSFNGLSAKTIATSPQWECSGTNLVIVHCRESKDVHLSQFLGFFRAFFVRGISCFLLLLDSDDAFLTTFFESLSNSCQVGVSFRASMIAHPSSTAYLLGDPFHLTDA
eukprot:CAMPEP_0117419068 /NCGR_PEP_ID=MMETSP0758-20121206/717_1 /TAXON_ID=63605 /ORGANISM="Percolomonas cosmopolitus, Strain AE-1 (ATCC 50343)" /LENGTH=188 /DNA_ID=CAMNT_0005199937 /DNA_START=1315 /DNA_END=1878 /DNA_ORIENTATION=+